MQPRDISDNIWRWHIASAVACFCYVHVISVALPVTHLCHVSVSYNS